MESVPQSQVSLLESILSRLPSRQFEDNVAALGYLVEDKSVFDSDFLSQPKILGAEDPETSYLGSSVNFLGEGQYRNSMVDTYTDDSKPGGDFKVEHNIEKYTNLILKKYIKNYFDDGNATFFLTDRSEVGRYTEGVFVVFQHRGKNKKMSEGTWYTQCKLRLTWEEDKKSGKIAFDYWKDLKIDAESKNFGTFEFDTRRRRQQEISFSEQYKYMTSEEFEIKQLGRVFESQENMTYNNISDCDWHTVENVINKSRRLEHNNDFYQQKVVILNSIFGS